MKIFSNNTGDTPLLKKYKKYWKYCETQIHVATIEDLCFMRNCHNIYSA